MTQPGYRHTQKGPLFLVLLVMAVAFCISAWALSAEPIALVLFLIVAVMFCVLAAAFRELTVEDRGEVLSVSFGPLPLFRKQFPYSDMTSVEAARSTLIDGLGNHYIPGRGWIYNLWGADCVAIRLGKRNVRIGTDDVPGLVAFLQSRLQARDRSE